MSKDDGGPAYPREDYQGGGGGQTGMSLRDWFAGQAMAGMMAFNGSLLGRTTKSPEVVAALAYEYADEMIKTRGQTCTGD